MFDIADFNQNLWQSGLFRPVYLTRKVFKKMFVVANFPQNLWQSDLFRPV